MITTSAPLRGADKHPPQTDTTQRKSKDGNEKSGFARRLSAKPRFFLLPRCLKPMLFLYGYFSIGGVIVPSFLLPFTFRNATATLCAVLLRCNTFCTVNCLSMPPHYFSLCSKIVYAFTCIGGDGVVRGKATPEVLAQMPKAN